MNATMVAVIRGKLSTGYFVKLIRYTITGSAFIADIYTVNKSSINIVNSGIVIGTPSAPNPCCGSIEDAVAQIQCQSGIAGPPTRMTGTFSTSPDGTTYIFNYGGNIETWMCVDGVKYFLIGANYSVNTPYGWAFHSAFDGSLNFNGSFSGQYQRYNGWTGGDEAAQNDLIVLSSYGWTTSGVLRKVTWDPIVRTWVYSYFARIGPLAVYQISHDMDNDGRIDTEKGHTYFGYPIYQNNIHRGFVFADASEAPPEGTFGAMYYWG